MKRCVYSGTLVSYIVKFPCNNSVKYKHHEISPFLPFSGHLQLLTQLPRITPKLIQIQTKKFQTRIQVEWLCLITR